MDEIKDWTFLSCAVVCLIADVYLAVGLRGRAEDRSLQMLILAFAAKAVSLTLSAPTVATFIDQIVGVPNVNALVVHLLGGVVYSTGMLVALSYWAYPVERAQRRAIIWIVLSVIMSGVLIDMWLAATNTVTARSGRYLLDNLELPSVAVYLLLYIASFVAGLLGVLLTCLRYARVATGAWLRRGLYVSAFGASVYLLYCVHRVVGVMLPGLRADFPDIELATPLCVGVGALLIVVGFTLPSWGIKLSAAALWWRDYRNHLALYPLWSSLYRQVPTIALDPPRSRWADCLRVRDVRYHLCRRVVEIQDARLSLQADGGLSVPAGQPRLADEVAWLVHMSRST
ncbi:MAB_1171c family putative transporter [Pseudonocardia sp. ICBG1293]|uniref:MAB_1171c family putative transporter n=1 Tax=Pseudonocardia sp. ICBG1293 TaxID=2844382 RepID=UPI001CCF4D79|nr:MAB_1171c family putative transporter [Pseudonocardia sp. ICBG1293]